MFFIPNKISNFARLKSWLYEIIIISYTPFCYSRPLVPYLATTCNIHWLNKLLKLNQKNRL